MTDSIRVLIVEDDFAVARLHARYLENVEGFDVVGSELTAASAAARLAEPGVDLVLLDMFLPDASGIELLRRIRAASTSPLDVIMVTSAPEADLVRQAFELGAVDYVLKPFQPDDFGVRLRRYAQQRRVASALAAAPLSQQQIDALRARPAAPRRASLPKGLSETTARAVAAELRSRAEPATAGDVGDALGMSRVSARRYLEYFAAQGDADVRPRYGEAGRPQNLYRWTGVGTA